MNKRIIILFLTLFAIAASSHAAEPATDGYRELIRQPDAVTVVTETGIVDLKNDGDAWSGERVRVGVAVRADGLRVGLAAREVAVKQLRLHWRGVPEAGGWKYLGDAWERSYGELEWKGFDANRPMPWYYLASDGQRTHAYGVMTLPAALCYWKLGEDGLTLFADVRCGGRGVQLGKRTLEVCTIVSRRGQIGETPFAAARAFCRRLCPHPRMPKQPVYGFNDWYCDYGKISADGVRKDAAFIARLSPAGGNRPYMVIDDGWQAHNGGAKGEWTRGNDRFPDMAALAADITKAGAKPGIWVRLLIAQPGQPDNWRLARDRAYLDPSQPAVRKYVLETVKRVRGWGYELIKHDFSTFDLSGRWGKAMGSQFTGDGWAFADRSRTTAEIIVDHYRSIREAAGDDAVVLGCNTIGHLSAGIFEASRIGDDTSGREWDRVRKMGVNTLAFRMSQHGAFYAVDADCAGQTTAGAIAWELNRQWLDLLARSGTPLFVSFKRDSVTPEQEQALKAALAIASKPQPSGEPLDWFSTRLPNRWKLDGKEREFYWSRSPAAKK